MLHAFEAVERTVGWPPDETHRRIHLPQIASDADEGPRRPEAGHEMRDRPGGLFPDLGTGRLEMGPPVRLVVVLVEIPVLPRLGGRDRFGTSLRAVRPLGGGREDELGPERLQGPLALRAEVRRDAQSHTISFGGPEHRERASRGPRRRVEEALAPRQARTLAGAHHPQRGAVLDAPARILP